MFKIWNFNLVLLIVCVCVFTTASCVCASDVNDADFRDLNSNCNSSIDETVFELDDVSGSFDDLQRDIEELSPGDIYNVTKDYFFDSGYGPHLNIRNPIINIATDNVTINGNGHVIDGSYSTALFKITGNNVKIFNLTFINSKDYGYNIPITYDISQITFNKGISQMNVCYKDEVSPIFWQGDNGIISNCKFYRNSALVKGGAITWIGNNGIIDSSIFINNTAGVTGGAIYMAGLNNTICRSIFINSTSVIGGEAIYLDRNHKKCNISAIYDGEKLITDGSITNIDVNYFSYSYESHFSGEKINLIPIIYSAIISRNDYVRLNGDTTYYAQYIGNVFIVTLTKNYDDGFTYQRGYHFYNIEDLNDVFQQLLEERYKNDVTLTKKLTVSSIKEYEYARTIRSNSIYTEEQFMTMNDDFRGVKDESFNEFSVQLNVDISSGLIIDSKNIWDPSKNGFNIININGHGSTIKVNSGDRDENKWVTITDGCIFSASNLIVEGFNTAVENLGGIGIFRNINFNKNHMDYWFDRDWGAAILNAGICICTNCSFTDNRCNNGGAVFNQGNLTINNCTFKGNSAYDYGNDVLNVDNGVVYVDGVQIQGSQGCVKYVESMSSTAVTVTSVLGVGVSFLLGTIAGTFTLNPAVGILVGAGIGAGVGALCSKLIVSNVYNVNLNRYVVCITLVAGCALAGALGGYLGCSLAQEWALEAAENNVIEESIDVDSIFSSSGLDDSVSLSDLSSECQEMICNMFTDGELEDMIAENSVHYVEAIV